jgi:DNA-binding SARP family transcriptional activator
MNILRVSLLGRFEAKWEGRPVPGFEHAKARELFSYLLLRRDKPNSREIIANYLWGGHYTTEVSKKYLRKALWQLNECLSHCSKEIQNDLIAVDANWLELRSIDSLWLDVAFLDDGYAAVKGMAGARLDEETAHVLANIVALYDGELLEGQYQEWSFYDLVRYRQVVLILLDKLMDYAMSRHEFESALEFGEQVLRHDAAREFTHIKLMRAYYALGDRTAAIRQYRLCCDILREELNVGPSHEASTLFEKIRRDEVGDLSLVRRDDSTHGVPVETPPRNGLELVVPTTGFSEEQRRRFSRLAADG